MTSAIYSFIKLLIFPALILSFFITPTGAMPNFDYDGRADFGVFRASDRTWYSYSTESQTLTSVQWGLPFDTAVPADYDDDGLTDTAVYREGVWYILQTRDQQPFVVRWGTTTYVPFGFVPDEPVPADYDGDGHADIAVWRPATGVWYILRSSSGFNPEYAQIFQWGRLGDVPVPADYDGDGKADFAVFRSTENNWYIWQSKSRSWTVRTFGRSGNDLLVPADYDGDGSTDLAVFREGIWYIEDSRDQQMDVFQFGLSTDAPVPADYDGDGLTDAAVFRSGVWYILESSTRQVKVFNFGLAGDAPVKSVNTGKYSIVAVP